MKSLQLKVSVPWRIKKKKVALKIHSKKALEAERVKNRLRNYRDDSHQNLYMASVGTVDLKH